MEILSQSALLVAVTSFAFGASVLARNVRNKLYLNFALVCAVISAWALSFFLEHLWEGLGFYRAHLVFNVWLAPAGVGLIRALVRGWPVPRVIMDVSLALAVLLTAAVGLRLDEAAPLVRQLMYFAPAMIVVQIFYLAWLDLRGHGDSKRAPRRNVIYLGALFVLGTSVMDHVPWIGPVIPVIGNVALTFYLFFVSQAISQQRFLNFGALFSRFLVVFAIAMTLTVIYSVLYAWIAGEPALFFLNSFIVSFLIVMLLEPIRALVRFLTHRLLTKKYQRLEEAVRAAQGRLTGIVDTESLVERMLSEVREFLDPASASVFVLSSEGTRFRKARTIGEQENRVPSELLADHPMVFHCGALRRRGDLPILLDQGLEAEIDRSASRVQREKLGGILEGLKALEANLIIPLIDDEQRCLGFVAAAAPRPPEPWGEDWGMLPIVYPYFAQAAQTLKSMGVYARSREKERLAELGVMAAGLAHEIRNPLGAIKGAAQFLDPSVERPESKFLKIIVDETDRLNRVVSQFLDYSKPRTEIRELANLAEIAAGAVETLRPSLPAGVSLELVRSDEAMVRCEPGQMRQVVLNLVQNSVNALSRRGEDERVRESVGGRIKVSVESGRHSFLSVEDDGPGISREHMEKLFIPFFTTSPSGTGLGLSICQRIVEAHQGRIEVASEQGAFTRFTVILPKA